MLASLSSLFQIWYLHMVVFYKIFYVNELLQLFIMIESVNDRGWNRISSVFSSVYVITKRNQLHKINTSWSLQTFCSGSFKANKHPRSDDPLNIRSYEETETVLSYCDVRLFYLLISGKQHLFFFETDTDCWSCDPSGLL